MSARYLNRKISSSFLIALMFVISSLSASVLPLDADIALENDDSFSFATNNSQNDAGSGGDAGNNSSSAVSLNAVNSSNIGWMDDTTDPDDLYFISIPSGYIINVTLAFSNTIDFDLYLADTALNFAYDSSEFNDPLEEVSSANTNISNGGVNIAIYVTAYSGYGQYTMNITFWSPNQVVQNDAGSGGDAGNLQSSALNLTSISSTYTGYVDNTLDNADLYSIFIPSGYELDVEISIPSNLNIDLLLIDGNWTFYVDQDLGITGGNGSVTTNGTNQSSGGVMTYFGLITNSGSGNYSMSISLVNPNMANLPSVSTSMVGKDLASISLSNLVVGSNYSLNNSVYEYPIGQNGTITNTTSYLTATSTTMWSNITLNSNDVEGMYAIIAMLMDGNGSYLGLDYDLMYFEMLESNISSRTTGNYYASNLTTGSSYSIYWQIYDNLTGTSLDTGWDNFSATSTTASSSINWNAPSSSNEHYIEMLMYDSSGNLIGFSEESFFPASPSIMVSSWTFNANSTNNSVDVSMSDLYSGDSYSYQTKISHQSNGTVIATSMLYSFTATSSNQQGQTFSYATPQTSGYYCAVSILYLVVSNGTNQNLDTDTVCFNYTFDADSDGVLNEDDLCPSTPLGSTVDQDGCAASQRDSDGDGWMDDVDFMPNDSTQWVDSDGDGFGDNINGTDGDLFPADSTQWEDADGDGYGDNPNGVNGDDFPMDSTQWSDADGDGYGDNPNGNGADMYPLDPTQWYDTDGDGYGDNDWGNNGDQFSGDPTQWSDRDGDGYGDNASGNNPDAFPDDSTQWSDQDGDGYGDNQQGDDADKFPSDSSQWADQDGDGYGDNQQGANPDAFPNDSTQWNDSDGDGYGDNQAGNYADLYPFDDSQWQDSDGDGFGDNASGTDGDQCPSTPLGQPVDEHGCSQSQRDSDSDGVKDYSDDCPNTMVGQNVDNNGCADTQLDDDIDGVNNTWDQCPNTAPTSIPDSSGCGPEQRDSDGDGIDDSRDICPITTAGESVDGNGCSDWEKDDDDDGVSNGKDLCEGTPANSIPDNNGCATSQKDTDMDSVMDDMDECTPTDPGSVVDSNGCADYQKDSDQDGVNDEGDDCPATIAGSQVNVYGCSDYQRDSDGDGRDDASDECADTPVNAIVDLQGCSSEQRDTDSDGVSDNLDECPFSPMEEIANVEGCTPSQLDSDNDGVSDAHDLFPLDPDETKDSDEDGVGDKEDYFPNDSTKSSINDIESNSWMIYALIAVVISVGAIIFFMRSKTNDGIEDSYDPEYNAVMGDAMPAMSLQDMAGIPQEISATNETQQQWVDDSGVNWVRQPDGSTMYFDRNTGEWTPYN